LGSRIIEASLSLFLSNGVCDWQYANEFLWIGRQSLTSVDETDGNLRILAIRHTMRAVLGLH